MFSARTASLARAIVPRAGVRTYAAAASSTKPPVALFGVDGTYASALVGSPGSCLVGKFPYFVLQRFVVRGGRWESVIEGGGGFFKDFSFV